MKKNSEPQDRLLDDLCACSAALSAIVEGLEAEGRSWDALTEAEMREVEAIGARVQNLDSQLDECAKGRRAESGPTISAARGLRV